MPIFQDQLARYARTQSGKAERMEVTEDCLQLPPRSVDFGGVVTARCEALQKTSVVRNPQVEVSQLVRDTPRERRGVLLVWSTLAPPAVINKCVLRAYFLF